MQQVSLRTVFPCCIKTFMVEDEHTLKVLANLAKIKHHRLKRYLREDKPVPDIMARRLEECTLGILQAQKVPANTTAKQLYSAPPYARLEWCSCKKIS